MGSNLDHGLGLKPERQESLTVSIGREEYEGGKSSGSVWGHNFTGLNYNLSNHSKRLEPQPGRPKKTLWQINRNQRESDLKDGQPEAQSLCLVD